MAIKCNGLFGKTSDGREVRSFTLTNQNGMEVEVLDYGCIIRAIKAPGKRGFEDVVLGYDDVAGYEKGEGYLGAAIGRYGNRIGKGRFTLDGVTYSLPINNGENALHGGIEGFNAKIWASRIEGDALIFSYTAADMEEGYPGKLDVTIAYRLSEDNAFSLEYKATADKNTVVNLTNHSYFNLSGSAKNSIVDEYIQINADYITETDKGSIPLGNLMPVDGTVFDLRKLTRIGDGIDDAHQQIQWAGGYDHNFVLGWDRVMKEAAVVEDAGAGRRMQVYTDQPGVQFYSANFLTGAKGKGGVPNDRRHALCLETQNFPDAPNHANFPSSVVRPGDVYHYTTCYKFSVL
ncbi:MAG: galactose mutarotase [Clostridia bacterium]|nr:galactose mutarotase [Clostridia bacterium]